ncbi:hypothetical protein Agub_g12042, partial [Astrephomene gubernaculifera]
MKPIPIGNSTRVFQSQCSFCAVAYDGGRQASTPMRRLLTSALPALLPSPNHSNQYPSFRNLVAAAATFSSSSGPSAASRKQRTRSVRTTVKAAAGAQEGNAAAGVTSTDASNGSKTGAAAAAAAAAASVRAGATGTAKPKQNMSSQLSSSTAQQQQLQLQLQQLESALARHRDLYYNQQQPEISDAAYDDLQQQYRQLAGRLAGVAAEEVALPVGAPLPPASPLRKVPHRLRMLSLAAVTSREELCAWLERTMARLPPVQPPLASQLSLTTASAAAAPPPGSAMQQQKQQEGEEVGKKTKKQQKQQRGKQQQQQKQQQVGGGGYRWVVEPKVDGLAVRVLYRRTEDGSYRLQEAATRGDGCIGEDVTHNALHARIAGLPLSFNLQPQQQQPPAASVAAASASARSSSSSSPLLPPPPPPPPPQWVEVRGEVFVRTADLELVNQQQAASGAPPLANPRNAASGGLRLQDPRQAAQRRLS